MAIIIEIFLALASYIGNILTSLHMEELKKYEKELTVALILVLILSATFFVWHLHRKNNANKEVNQVFLSTCKEHFNQQEYAHILELVRDDKFESAESCMVYAYCLAYGYGVDKNIPLSIEYFKKANDKGASNAISNMVVSVVKNSHTKVKIDAVKYAFDAGNEMAVQYVNYVLSSWNSKTQDPKGKLTPTDIWSLDENTLLKIMNGPFYYWVCSNQTYKNTMPVLSTPNFTRQFLYQIGTNRVYRECRLVVNKDFPSWFNENIW